MIMLFECEYHRDISYIYKGGCTFNGLSFNLIDMFVRLVESIYKIYCNLVEISLLLANGNIIIMLIL